MNGTYLGSYSWIVCFYYLFLKLHSQHLYAVVAGTYKVKKTDLARPEGIIKCLEIKLQVKEASEKKKLSNFQYKFFCNIPEFGIFLLEIDDDVKLSETPLSSAVVLTGPPPT